MTDDVTDRIARAIYAADFAGEPSYKTFDTLHPDDQDHYRSMAVAVVEELPVSPGALQLYLRLKAFSKDCVANGDMTPSAQRMLLKILTDWGKHD